MTALLKALLLQILALIIGGALIIFGILWVSK